MTTINCFLCQSPLEVRTSKKEKLYLVCDDCGIQMFVRLPKGIRRLKEHLKDGKSLTDNFVFCRKCRIGVEKCRKTHQEPVFAKDGFYCPSCEELLLAVSRKELERR